MVVVMMGLYASIRDVISTSTLGIYLQKNGGSGSDSGAAGTR